MKPAIPERYLRCDDFAARIDQVTCAPEVWGVFAKLDQPRDATELAGLLPFDPPLIEASLQLLLDHKLIRNHVLSWRDYAAASAHPPTPLQVLTPPPPAVVAGIALPLAHSAQPAKTPPRAAGPPPVPSATKPAAQGTFPAPQVGKAGPMPSSTTASTVVSYRLPAYRNPQPRPAAAVSLRLASPGHTVPTLASARDLRWRLSPVLKAIGAKAGGGLAGHLLIYRVFLHVPASLMRAGGLHSLGLRDENLIVAHAPLRAAIAEAAKVHAGLEVGHLLTS